MTGEYISFCDNKKKEQMILRAGTELKGRVLDHIARFAWKYNGSQSAFMRQAIIDKMSSDVDSEPRGHIG